MRKIKTQTSYVSSEGGLIINILNKTKRKKLKLKSSKCN